MLIEVMLYLIGRRRLRAARAWQEAERQRAIAGRVADGRNSRATQPALDFRPW